MKIKIINDLNITRQAKELGVSVWQTPSFLFIMMGVITAIVMAATYYVAKNYDSPEVIVVSESIIVVVIFTIGNIVISGVEQIAKLNKMKSEFIAVASHQLRTPLSAIKWNIELLLSKPNHLNDQQREEVKTIEELSQRMNKLVSDLLDVARIDQGRLVLKKERFDFTKIVRKVIKDVSSLAKSKQVRIILKRGKSKLPFVVGDAEKLRLVIENLLSNSIKYTTDKGRVELEITKKHNSLMCSIKDNGVGIPHMQQGQIFNKFFRSGNVSRYQTEGSGLGLYIAKNIIDQSGGKIWFESRENVGTTFNFSLPLHTS